MSATFTFCEHNGPVASIGSTGLTSGVTQVNWKSVDDVATAYAAAPIVAGTNSYEKWQFVRFGGTYTQILNGRFAHTGGALPSGVSLFGPPAMTSDSTRLAYPSAPSRSTNGNLTDISAVTDISQGAAVFFGLGQPGDSGKAASYTPGGGSVAACTNYLTTQLRTTGDATTGAGGPLTLTFRFDENAVVALLVPAFSLFGSLLLGSLC